MRVFIAATLFGCTTPPPMTEHACFDAPTADGRIVARVGNTALTVPHLVGLIDSLGESARANYLRPQKLRQFVEDQIRYELLVRAALERGLQRDPQVIEAARKIMVRQLLQRDLGPDEFENRVGEKAIARYYERHMAEYIQPETRRVAEIRLAPTEAGRALAQNLIDQLNEKSDDAELFSRLAARHSTNALTRYSGGEMLHQEQEALSHEYGPNFATEVFVAPVGKMLPHPVQSTRGWHVVHVIARREALQRSLDEVRDNIRQRLLRDHRTQDFEQYLSTIRERHPVALYTEELDALMAELQKESTE